jgi:hypothetical protein
MAHIIRIKQGIAVSVYDDRFRPIYQALGVATITRATDVEYDATQCAWIATERTTGQIIAYGPERDDVIRQEIEYLEGKL